MLRKVLNLDGAMIIEPLLPYYQHPADLKVLSSVHVNI